MMDVQDATMASADFYHADVDMSPQPWGAEDDAEMSDEFPNPQLLDEVNMLPLESTPLEAEPEMLDAELLDELPHVAEPPHVIAEDLTLDAELQPTQSHELESLEGLPHEDDATFWDKSEEMHATTAPTEPVEVLDDEAHPPHATETAVVEPSDPAPYDTAESTEPLEEPVAHAIAPPTEPAEYLQVSETFVAPPQHQPREVRDANSEERQTGDGDEDEEGHSEDVVRTLEQASSDTNAEEVTDEYPVAEEATDDAPPEAIENYTAAVEEIVGEAGELPYSLNDLEEQDFPDEESLEDEPQFVRAEPHDESQVEPPPSIALSFPSANTSFFLFKGTEDGSSSSNGIQLVLFQSRQSLCRGPLADVFDALRNEPELSRHIDDGELVLDCPGLGLSISEDNKFTSEVTAADLDLLHAGSGADGPLRMELRLRQSRFITRYRYLMEKLHREVEESDRDNSSDTEKEQAEDVDHNAEPNEGTEDYQNQHEPDATYEEVAGNEEEYEEVEEVDTAETVSEGVELRDGSSRHKDVLEHDVDDAGDDTVADEVPYEHTEEEYVENEDDEDAEQLQPAEDDEGESAEQAQPRSNSQTTQTPELEEETEGGESDLTHDIKTEMVPQQSQRGSSTPSKRRYDEVEPETRDLLGDQTTQPVEEVQDTKRPRTM